MYVYFIQVGDDGPIKVGISWYPFGRLAHLQAANPYELRLIGTHEADWDARRVEQELHSQLSRSHIRNEWYRPSRLVMRTVREISDPKPTKPEFPPIIRETLTDDERYERLSQRVRLLVDGDAAPMVPGTDRT